MIRSVSQGLRCPAGARGRRVGRAAGRGGRGEGGLSVGDNDQVGVPGAALSGGGGGDEGGGGVEEEAEAKVVGDSAAGEYGGSDVGCAAGGGFGISPRKPLNAPGKAPEA